MNRRDRTKPPRAEMIWSEQFGMWLDPDTRTPERRAEDERIAREFDADKDRFQAAMKRLQAAQELQSKALGIAADGLAAGLLASLIGEREKAGLSRAEVARRMNVPPSAVARLEAGTHSPTLATISRYSAAIGVRLEVGKTA